MLRLECPICGPRDHDEFTYLEDGSVTYPKLSNDDQNAWFEAVYLRDNPRGIHSEKWHHTLGCRTVLLVERDTVTHNISKIIPANPKLAAALKHPTTLKKSQRS